MTKKVSDEQMREMQQKLAGLGITRPSKKQALKAIKKGARNVPIEETFDPAQIIRDTPVVRGPNFVGGDDPRVTKVMEILEANPDMDAATAVFQVWSGMGGKEAMGSSVAKTLDNMSESLDDEAQTTTGDPDDQA